MPEIRPFEKGEFIENDDGSRSTERLVTIDLGNNRWVNVPSLWMTASGPIDLGQNEDVISALMSRFEAETDKQFPRFQSFEEAIKAAEARSNKGGASQGSIFGQ